MARLPGQGHLIQQIGTRVVLFEDHTEAEIASAEMGDGNQIAQAQEVIAHSDLDEEDKAFAHFWFGYFWAFGAYPEMVMPEWGKTGWPKAVDSSMSFMPGTQWGLNFARRVGESAELDASVKRAVEKHLNVFVQAIETEFGIDATVIPRPSWKNTGLVGSVEDINAVVAELEAAEPPGTMLSEITYDQFADPQQEL